MASRRRVAWTFEAARALDEVLDHLSGESGEAARRVATEAVTAARSLESFADRGRVVPELAAQSIREIFVYRYRLIYRVHGESVEVLAFIHGARDFDRWRDQS